MRTDCPVQQGNPRRERDVVLIVGSGRNGSSLMLRLLDGSAGLHVYPNDFNYFRTFTSVTWKKCLRDFLARLILGKRARELLEIYYFRRWSEAEWHSLVRDILPNFPDLDPLSMEVDDSATEGIPRGVAEACMQFFHNFCKKYGVIGVDAMLVLKTTECARIPEYMSMLSARRCVHVFRDPVKTYASIKRTHLFKSRPPWYDGGDILREIVEARWNTHVNLYRELVAHDPEGHIAIRYEDLIQNPRQEVAKVCAFLGVPLPAEPTRQTVLGGREMRRSASNPSQLGLLTPQEVNSNLEREANYVEVVEPREEQLIRVLTRKNSDFLGYPAPDTSISDEDLLSAWRSPDKSEVAFWFRPWGSIKLFVNRRRWLRRQLRAR
jgi:LPS sulfotransferase NodH